GAVTRVLVDTSPDLREQLLEAEVNSIDGVFYTHGHADHTHGIDDLRPLFIKARRQVNVYLDEPTGRAMEKKFRYCFETPQGSDYPPIVRANRIAAGQRIEVEGPGGIISVLPVLQEHGEITSLGYRFDGLAYSCDINGLPDESVDVMTGLHVWIVDALRDAPHPSHFNLAETLAWIQRLKPRRTILTNLNPEFDYEALRSRLPPHVEPAYDGMQIKVNAK